jgi:hypothetical protein
MIKDKMHKLPINANIPMLNCFKADTFFIIILNPISEE